MGAHDLAVLPDDSQFFSANTAAAIDLCGPTDDNRYFQS